MKITKGMKLTDAQKAQRAESRLRNQAKWLEEFESRQAQEKSRRESESRKERVLAETLVGMRKRITDLENEFARRGLNSTVPKRLVNLAGKAPASEQPVSLEFQHVPPAVQKALQSYNQRCWQGKQNIASVAWAILHYALSNPDMVDRMITSFCRYRDAEGLAGTEASALLTARIASHRAYRCN